jgi:ferredoxin-NADP reductase
MLPAAEALAVSGNTLNDRDMVIVNKQTIARDVVALTLADPKADSLPGWTPGAHLDLEISPGLVRQYSLCGPIDDDQHWTIAILREEHGRGGSRAVHDDLHEGSTVRVLAVRNKFPLEPAERYLFIAGGIGITPISPMIAAADMSQRPWRLYYGGRTRDSMAFAHALSGRYGPSVLVVPEDERGLLDLDAILDTRAPGQHVYCCGPAGLLAAVEARFTEQTKHLLHTERFAAAAPTEEQIATDRPIEVTLRRSGKKIVVPADRSILDVLRDDHGMDLVSGCEQGICGTCEATVLEGTPDHRDQVLSPAERAGNATIMLCVSRSRNGALTLDL